MAMPRKIRWSKDQFIKAVANSKTAAEAMRLMGEDIGSNSYAAFKRSAREWGVDTSHFLGLGHSRGKSVGRKKRIEHYLVEGKTTSSHRLKQRLIEEGLKEPKCEICKISEWMGKPCPLELDHINGVHSDNRLGNLRVVCPNCHAQTPTHAGKNKGVNS